MNKIDTILKKAKSDTFLSKVNNQKVKFELKNKLLNSLDKRIFNRLTQKDIAKTMGVSVSTIKRLENGDVYDISIIENYVDILEGLPNRKKIEIPKWV